MEVINPLELFGANIEILEEEFKPLPKKGTEDEHLNNYYEPTYFFLGVIYSLLFCIPFWIILFCLIT